MKIPGFTAEAALYWTRDLYSMARPPDAPVAGGKIVPQAGWIVDHECYHRVGSWGVSGRSALRVVEIPLGCD